MDRGERIIIGLTEETVIHGYKDKKTTARIDTGATHSSMDVRLAEKLRLGPILRKKKVKSAHGSDLRPVVGCKVSIAGRKIRTEFTLADRSHMKYKVLIGQNTLKKLELLIDPNIA